MNITRKTRVRVARAKRTLMKPAMFAMGMTTAMVVSTAAQADTINCSTEVLGPLAHISNFIAGPGGKVVAVIALGAAGLGWMASKDHKAVGHGVMAVGGGVGLLTGGASFLSSIGGASSC